MAQNAHVAIQCDNLHFLYSGIGNPISVAVSGVQTKDVTISVAEGEATVTATKEVGHYIVSPSGQTNKVTLAVDVKENGKTRRAATQVYKVKDIPEPELSVGGFRSGDRVKAASLSGGFTIVAKPVSGFDFQIPKGSIRVLSHEFSCGTTTLSPIEGNVATPEELGLIRNAKAGDLIVITAKVLMPDGRLREVDFVARVEEGMYFMPAKGADGKPMVDAEGRAVYYPVPMSDLLEDSDEEG